MHFHPKHFPFEPLPVREEENTDENYSSSSKRSFGGGIKMSKTKTTLAIDIKFHTSGGGAVVESLPHWSKIKGSILPAASVNE
jgi:hypothetical protein